MNVRTPVFRVLAAYLVLALFVLSLPSQGWAMFVPAAPESEARSGDWATIQSALESKVVRQRLMDYGLTADEAAAKLSQLPDEQLHELAANIDALQAGGDGVGALIFLALVAIVVIVVLQATGHDVIMKRR